MTEKSEHFLGKIKNTVKADVMSSVALVEEGISLAWYSLLPVLIYHGFLKDSLNSGVDVVLPEDRPRRPLLEKVRTLVSRHSSKV